MEQRREALVLGIGNLLWADEGFGVRAVEALHASWAFPDAVELQDGGTLGLNLYQAITSARRVLVFDAIDFGLPPGTLAVLRDDEVPAWGRTKLSPHQIGFNDVLAIAQLNGCAPDRIVAVGVQPAELSDFGGSLSEPVRKCLPDAIAVAARELALWGYPGKQRRTEYRFEPLHARSLALHAYERGRPSAAEACRRGDARLLTRTQER
jgi:hydrogenase maturation protease